MNKRQRRERLTWCLPAAEPAQFFSWPNPPPQPPCRLPPWTEGQTRGRRAHAGAAPPPAPPCRALRQPNPAPEDGSNPLSPLPYSLHSLPLLCPFPSSRPRATELAAAARLTTVPPSPSHCAKKLRRFVLDVPTEPRVARSPERPHRRGHLQPSVAKIAGARSSPSTPPPSR